MEYKEVAKPIEDSEKRADEVLKAARLQRHERTPMPKERLELILNYVVGILALILTAAGVYIFMYFMFMSGN